MNRSICATLQKELTFPKIATSGRKLEKVGVTSVHMHLSCHLPLSRRSRARPPNCLPCSQSDQFGTGSARDFTGTRGVTIPALYQLTFGPFWDSGDSNSGSGSIPGQWICQWQRQDSCLVEVSKEGKNQIFL